MYESRSSGGVSKPKMAAGLACFMFFIYLMMPSSSSPTPWFTKSTGELGTEDFELRFFRDVNGENKEVSCWHDIPLMSPGGGYFYVNEIPRGTTRKMETQTKLPFNPIKQDTKKGKVREYTYGKTFFNYGGIPQTWEDPDEFTNGLGGDNDPVDVMEIGSRSLAMGEVVNVNVLGAIGMHDQGEIDWKIICIDRRDPNAKLWKDISDVDEQIIDNLRDWLINYKTTDGKPKNVLADKDLNREEAEEVIAETNKAWLRLQEGNRPYRGLWLHEKSTTVPLAPLLSMCISLAKQAGARILDVHANGADAVKQESKGSTLEGVDDPVTLADKASNSIIRAALLDAYPDINFVSEEDATPELEDFDRPALTDFDEADPDYTVRRQMKDLTIWLDPLDATKEFTESISTDEEAGDETLEKFVSVMVCIVDQGTPIGGVLHYPFTKETYYAMEGIKTTPTGLPIPRQPGKDDTVEITVSRSHAGDIAEALDGFQEYKLISAAGSGYKSTLVLKGEADAYVHTTRIKKWDLCAPHALVRAGGGKFTDKFGEEFKYGSTREDHINDRGVLAARTDNMHRSLVEHFLKNDNK